MHLAPDVAQSPPVIELVDLEESGEEMEERAQLVRKRALDDEGASKMPRFEAKEGPSSPQIK